MRNGSHHGQPQAAAPASARARIVRAPESLEDMGCEVGGNTRAIVLDTQMAPSMFDARLNPYRTGHGMPMHVFEQGQQRLPNPDRIAAHAPRLQIQDGVLARGAEHVPKKRHNGFDFSGKVGLPHLKVQMAAFRQADHAQILDQPGQAFDLGQQAAELGFIGGEDPFCQALQASAQYGDRRAQFVGNRSVPEHLLFGHALQLIRQRVEVVGEQGRLAQRAIARDGTHAQIAPGDPAKAVGHRVQRHQDPARQIDRHDDRHRQTGQGGGDQPHPLRPRR